MPPIQHDFLALLGRVSAGENLSQEEMAAAVDHLMEGAASDEQIAMLLTALAHKGETVDEVAGAAESMRRHMTPLRTTRTDLVDTCGTGGGGSTTFNVSTTAALVAAAAGANVAKHGNRSVTSRTGSADVLAELGVNIEATVPQVEACLDQLGVCFCYAPLMHPAMRHVGAVRKQLGIRTIFNVLGPLANPAGARRQLLGAGRPELRPLLAGAIARLGTDHTLVVSGDDGLGDVTITGGTRVSDVRCDASGKAELKEFSWTPEDFGVDRGGAAGIEVEGPEHSAAVIRKILKGAPGAARDIVVLNAAATLIVAGLEKDPRAAGRRASEAIDTGATADLLAALATLSHAPA
ncbi:Anthranilate phosphoribosyltransferase [Pseudobythopirellula maris]|uniref:Anthranilate phosphoribosyltransferase n=1 Tax=Pseudobythopirellula maris TaxID=2527991 RepID=A0A5C5ZIX4_9BACT|nr:anthranilate phosphoribosyltransferase [Pseudobythopirellula maris]TWT87299.1 Anthranilate phosphoribosyltransferase [Pseudobythopirellula maris]